MASVKERIERALLAHGEWNKENCTCDASVGHQCEYCAVHDGLMAAKEMTADHLKQCCGVDPEPVAGGNYPGALRYECPKCKKTTLGAYSTLGNTLEVARKLWNNKG